MKKKDIVLSAASVASAISAISQLGQSGVQISADMGNNRFTEAAQNAVTGSQAQRHIRANTLPISNVIKLDEKLISQSWYLVAQGDNDVCDFHPNSYGCPGYVAPPPTPAPAPAPAPAPSQADDRKGLGPLLSDSSIDTRNGSNYQANNFGCYTNCHSACHGSRGWR